MCSPRLHAQLQYLELTWKGTGLRIYRTVKRLSLTFKSDTHRDGKVQSCQPCNDSNTDISKFTKVPFLFLVEPTVSVVRIFVLKSEGAEETKVEVVLANGFRTRRVRFRKLAKPTSCETEKHPVSCP